MRGLVALGDSITVGEGSMQLGVRSLGWAQWLAKAMDLPYTCYAVNGATTPQILAGQLPHIRDGHDLACVYAGVNDVRFPAFDLTSWSASFEALVAGVAVQVPRVLVLTLPHDLGRPTSAPKPARAEPAIRAAAAAHGATVCSLADFGGRMDVLPDTVHPTALGQLEIADRAARALGLELLPSAVAGVGPRTTRGLISYAPTIARGQLRQWRHVAVERARR